MGLENFGSADVECVRCSRPMVTIELDTHTLRSCSYCELRLWDDNGELVDRAAVLAGMAAVLPRSR
jgi:hypothetical protein